jgi:hypothetical protein
LIKVYAGEVDAKLGAAASEAVRLGVDGKTVAPAVGSNEEKTAEADNIVDRTDEIKDRAIPGRKVKLDRFDELLAEYRAVLLKNDCTTDNADMLVSEFREALAPHFKSLSEGTVEQVLYLGCNGLNERIKAFIAAKIEEVKALEAEAKAKAEELAKYEADMQSRIDDLIKRVIALVKEGSLPKLAKSFVMLSLLRMRSGMRRCMPSVSDF